MFAENDIGASEPVVTTEPITAKNPFGKSHRFSVMAGHNYNLNRENFTEKPIQNGHSKVG